MDRATAVSDHADELLVVRCQLGERDAFDALIRRWSASLHRYAFKLAGEAERANDLVQDVWLAVLRGLPNLRDAAQFRPWLFGIAHRTFMERLRGRYAMPVDDGVDLEAVAADPADDDRELRERALVSGLEQLPLIEREVLTLFYLEALSLADIASALRIPAGTVKSRLFRARTLLRRHLHLQEN